MLTMVSTSNPTASELASTGTECHSVRLHLGGEPVSLSGVARRWGR
jgi:hypothetical protein